MSGMGNGLATAVALLGGAGELPPEAEQDDLFDAPDAPMPLPPAARSGPKGGRPKGARNKSTEAWVSHVLGQFRSPLIVLCELYSRTPVELAQQLQLYKWHEGRPVLDANGEHVVDTGAAASIQVQAAIAALPYLHQKLPQALEITPPKQRGVMVFDLGDGANGQSDGVLVPMAYTQQNQKVIDAEVVKSDGGQSDAGDKPLTDKDNGNGND